MTLRLFDHFRHWLQQPTTLSGLSMFVGAAAGLWTGAIAQDMGYSLMGASLPLLLPDNTTAQRIGQAALLPLVATLSRNTIIPPLSSDPSPLPNEKSPYT
ncbi:hypothetical protein PT277_05155 [Acetobacteraceae bacterium ESL0709]|nr:hypothetical protein [Acetobacteraceae bacterium ESL0697]MDF7678083.1 hypothetical protein [Acetobacteraceae bacterium ESL0709]